MPKNFRDKNEILAGRTQNENGDLSRGTTDEEGWAGVQKTGTWGSTAKSE